MKNILKLSLYCDQIKKLNLKVNYSLIKLSFKLNNNLNRINGNETLEYVDHTLVLVAIVFFNFY